jgi:multimeric flavodoxin WrbA
VSLARLGVQRDHREGARGLRRGAGARVRGGGTRRRCLRADTAQHATQAHQAHALTPARRAREARWRASPRTRHLDHRDGRRESAVPTSDALLEHALDQAKRRGADTQYIKLRDLKVRHCEGNYSKAARACTWPCAITERDPEDQLTAVYEGLVHWADVVILGTPIRWGNASSLYYKMIERLNCVQNQVTIHNTVLIKNKVAAFIITGGQDNIQAVAGSMFTFWAELGFIFPPFPFIAHSRGWDAEDMQNNVRQVRTSDTLRDASYELLDRALDFWTIIDKHKAEMDKPMERAGRKANTLPEPDAAEEEVIA